MHRPPYLIPALAAGLIFLISVIAFRSYMPYAGGALAPKEPPKVVLAMRNAYFVGLGRKGKVWSIKAKTVEIGQDRSLTTISGITDGKIYDSGKPAFRVRAKKASYDSRMESLRLWGGIAVEGNRGERVTADSAQWNSSSSTLRSNGRVRFQSRESETLAKNLVVDIHKKELTMSDVSGTVNISEVGGKRRQEAGNDAR